MFIGVFNEEHGVHVHLRLKKAICFNKAVNVSRDSPLFFFCMGIFCLNGHVAGTTTDTAAQAPLQGNGTLWTNF